MGVNALGIDQHVGLQVWSPLGWGRLTGKIGRGKPLPETSRLKAPVDYGPPVDDEYVFNVVDVLEDISKETGKTIPQIALNWLLQRPTVCNVVIGARNEEQLRDNLGAAGWDLTPQQIAKLDAASDRTLVTHTGINADSQNATRLQYNASDGFRARGQPWRRVNYRFQSRKKTKS